MALAVAMAWPAAAATSDPKPGEPAAQQTETVTTPVDPARQPDSSATVASVPSAPPGCCTLTALTPIEFEILTPASSKTSHQGDQIRLRVVEPIQVDGKTVIPAGTEGFAEIIQASPARFGGKAGELVVGAPYLMLGSQRVGLKRLRYGSVSGRDNTNTAMIVSIAAGGLFGLMVGGGNVEVQSGAHANAVVTRDTFVSIQPANSNQE
jgi:hypothetical protein